MGWGWCAVAAKEGGDDGGWGGDGGSGGGGRGGDVDVGGSGAGSIGPTLTNCTVVCAQIVGHVPNKSTGR